MDFETFKFKNKDLIDLGVVKILYKHPYEQLIDEVVSNRDVNLKFEGKHVEVSRFVNNRIVASTQEIAKPIRHLKKMGYVKGMGIGIYTKT